MRSMARIFGAPETVPAGKHARNASSASSSGLSSPSTTDVRCMTCENRSTRMSSFTFTVPERERVWCGSYVEALREHDLDAVALRDELARLFDAPHVILGRPVRADLDAVRVLASEGR